MGASIPQPEPCPVRSSRPEGHSASSPDLTTGVEDAKKRMTDTETEINARAAHITQIETWDEADDIAADLTRSQSGVEVPVPVEHADDADDPNRAFDIAQAAAAAIEDSEIEKMVESDRDALADEVILLCL